MFAHTEEILRREVAEGICHGYALAVGCKGKTLHVAAGGTLGDAAHTPATSATRYDISSLTGMVATLPLMLLALESGRLSLSDRLSTYFTVPQDKRDITLEHLLTHTSGMEADFLLEQAAETPQDALGAILSRPLVGPAGKQARPSGVGMILLGKVLETVFSATLDTAARQRVFVPLGMMDTGYLPTGTNIAHTAADGATGEPRIGVPNDENALFLHGVSGGAGVFSTVEDCSRFLAMLANDGMVGKRAFLSRQSLGLVARDHTAGLGSAYGLVVQLACRGATFMGELWPASGYGHVSQTTGCTLALDPVSGLHAALFTSRMKVSRESEAMLRVRRLAHNALCAEALRGVGRQEKRK